MSLAARINDIKPTISITFKAFESNEEEWKEAKSKGELAGWAMCKLTGRDCYLYNNIYYLVIPKENSWDYAKLYN